MQTALFVMPPFAAQYLSYQAAASLALDLKAMGVSRVDLTSDNLFETSGRHNAYAVPAFKSAAENATRLIGQVLGTATTYDIAAKMRGPMIPKVENLVKVAANCLRHVEDGNAAIDARDARDLGIVFYAAVHAHRYDSVVFPHLSSRAHKALFIIGKNLRGMNLQDYGRPILLNNMRGKIADLCQSALPAPGQTFN